MALVMIPCNQVLFWRTSLIQLQELLIKYFSKHHYSTEPETQRSILNVK